MYSNKKYALCGQSYGILTFFKMKEKTPLQLGDGLDALPDYSLSAVRFQQIRFQGYFVASNDEKTSLIQPVSHIWINEL